MELTEHVQRLVSDVLDVDVKNIPPLLQQGDIAEWDSLAHLRIMNELEQEFGVYPTMKQIAQLTSIPTITQFIQSSQLSGT